MIAKEFALGNDFPRIDYATWRKAVEAELKGAPFDKKMVSRTYEGIDLQPIYTEETFATSGDPGGMPGFAPFARGAQVLGNALTEWDIRQEHVDPDPAEVNAQILDDLSNGVSSIVLRLDAAGSAGYDADDRQAAELSGRDGVIISTADDLQRALAKVHLDIAGVWLEAGAAFLPAAALHVTAARLAGVEPERLLGAFNADPLGTLMREGSLPVPLKAALEQMADLAAWTAAHAPHMTAVEVGTAPYHHAGATTTQDLGVPARHRRRVPASAHLGRVGRQRRGEADRLQRQHRLPVLPGHRQDPSSPDALGATGRVMRRRCRRTNDAAARDDEPARADEAQPGAQHPAQHRGLLRRRHGRRRRHHHGSLRRSGHA